MSDKIPTIGNNEASYKSILIRKGRSSPETGSCSLDSNLGILNREEDGISVQEKGFILNEGAIQYCQHEEMLRPSSPLDHGTSFTDIIDDHFLCELERISSGLIRFLNKARQMKKMNESSSDQSFQPSDKTSRTDEKPRTFDYGFHAPREDAERMDAHQQKYKKRGRSLLNDETTELKNRLPKHIDRLSFHTIDSILKGSIDYIKMLKNDNERIQLLKHEMMEREILIMKLALRIQRLELLYAAKLENKHEADVRK